MVVEVVGTVPALGEPEALFNIRRAQRGAISRGGADGT